MNKGFAIIPVLVILGLSALGGFAGSYIALQGQPEPDVQLGTASNIFYTTSVLPNATSTSIGDIGTTSESGDRRFRYGFIDYATSSAVSIFDELTVGRTATATINELGNATVQDLSVLGTCTGCSGASTADFQDAYNNSAADATILSVDGKELVYIIADTTDPAEFVISAQDQGSLQLAVGSTTNGVWHGYGALGIGTTSPGGGLAVNATSTVLSGIAYVLDHLKTSFLIATSTTASSTLPELTSTNITTTGLRVLGDLNVDNGTSTLQGSTFTGLFTTNGLNVSSGDLLLAGVLKISNTGTSTNLGTFQVNSGGTGTSTFTNIEATSIRFTGAFYNPIASSTNTGTTTLIGDCSLGPKIAFVMDKDVRFVRKNCFGGQSQVMYIDNPGHNDADQLVWWDGADGVESETSSSTLKFNNATSTTGYISQGALNICVVTYATSSDNISIYGVLDCGDTGYEYR